MTFLNQITIKTEVEKEKFFRFVQCVSSWLGQGEACYNTASHIKKMYVPFQSVGKIDLRVPEFSVILRG